MQAGEGILVARNPPVNILRPSRDDAKSLVDDSQIQTRETALGRRTTTVPAILSCQPCLAGSQPIQKKPRKSMLAEKSAARMRTSAVRKLNGCPSCRTTCKFRTIPPTVVPFQAHIPEKYAIP